MRRTEIYAKWAGSNAFVDCFNFATRVGCGRIESKLLFECDDATALEENGLSFGAMVLNFHDCVEREYKNTVLWASRVRSYATV